MSSQVPAPENAPLNPSKKWHGKGKTTSFDPNSNPAKKHHGQGLSGHDALSV